MKILIIGSGGREHALTWKLASAGHTLYCAPGNPGIATQAEILDIAVSDHAGLVSAAHDRAVDLVVIGPEAPLVAGLADRLRSDGFAVFGPGRQGAALEGSKIFAKEFFARHGIRSAAFFACSSADEADQAITRLLAPGPPGSEPATGVVVKADGLAAGKGVVVCSDAPSARAAARAMLDDGQFGAAGSRIVVEERISGRELSVMAITDGERCEILAVAEDHKAIHDGDRGANTGGMGTVSPCTWVSDALLARIERDIFEPTLRGLSSDSIEYRGVLYAGLMIDRGGLPWILEYNCRFGDPETQPVLARLRGDLAPWLAGAAVGRLPDGPLAWHPGTAVCVILASPGYPETSTSGLPITGLSGAHPEALPGASEDSGAGQVLVFHAGTAWDDDRDVLVTAGGRVLGVTALARDLAGARRAAYDAVSAIAFTGMQYRRDIGARGDTAMKPVRVAILMGSRSDLELMKPASELLGKLGIAHEVRILSAHRTPERTAAYAAGARGRGVAVLICAAGGAAHLAGAVAAQTTLPVIGVPLARTPLGGQDALLATVQMPPGMPVATVAIDGAYNAALLAAEILAVSDEGVRTAVEELRAATRARVIADDEDLQG